MTLRMYLAKQILAVTGLSGDQVWNKGLRIAVLTFGPVIAILDKHMSGLLSSSMFFWVTIFWALDWLLGGIKAWRAKKWSARRGFYSVWKWVGWVIALTIAWGMRDSGVVGGGLIAGCIEAAVLFTEGASVLRNLADLLPEKSVFGGLMRVMAKNMERKLEEEIKVPGKNGVSDGVKQNSGV